MSDQNILQIIRQKIEDMKAHAIETRKMYPERYRDARKTKTTAISTLNGVLKIFDSVISEKNGEGENGEEGSKG